MRLPVSWSYLCAVRGLLRWDGLGWGERPSQPSSSGNGGGANGKNDGVKDNQNKGNNHNSLCIKYVVEVFITLTVSCTIQLDVVRTKNGA